MRHVYLRNKEIYQQRSHKIAHSPQVTKTNPSRRIRVPEHLKTLPVYVKTQLGEETKRPKYDNIIMIAVVCLDICIDQSHSHRAY